MLQRQVGDIVINRIIESERPDFDAAQFFPKIAADQWAPYRQRLAGWAMETASNALIFPMQSFLLRTRHHTIEEEADPNEAHGTKPGAQKRPSPGTSQGR